jgi:hypothetical protein
MILLINEQAHTHIAVHLDIFEIVLVYVVV